MSLRKRMQIRFKSILVKDRTGLQYQNTNNGAQMINENEIKAKGPEKVSFYELVGIAIQRLEDSTCSEKKKDQAAKTLLAMAEALDRNPEWMEGK